MTYKIKPFRRTTVSCKNTLIRGTHQLKSRKSKIMERWQDKVAVVTGASSGIGAAITIDLVKAGLVVVGLARRVERIEALKEQLPEDLQSHLHVVKCDVGVESSIAEAFDWVEAQLGGVDILINSAGMLHLGQVLTLELDKLNEVMQVNLMSVINCTQRAFRSMKQREVAGHVVLINSLTGQHVISAAPDEIQNLNMYPITKHGITGLLEVLRQELNGFKTKIKVTSITPGVTDTELLPNEFRSLPMIQPEDVAAGIMYALATPPHVQVHQLTIKPIGEQF